MLEPPPVADAALLARASASYGIPLTSLAFLPLGQDAAAWVLRAETADGAAYLLKLRRGSVHPAALRAPRYLADHGATHVVAPLATLSQRLWDDVDGLTLTLYPFINGVTGAEHGLHERHWLSYGAALREIHDAPLTPELAADVTREDFTLAQLFQRQRQTPWGEVVAALEAHRAQRTFADASERELAAFWRAKRAEIQALIARFATLGQRLRATDLPLVDHHGLIEGYNRCNLMRASAVVKRQWIGVPA